MKKTFTLLSLLSIVASASAQISLTQSSYASWTPKTDSLGTFTSGIPAVSVNAANDISGVTYASNYGTVAHTAGTNAAFTAATFYTPFTDVIPSSVATSSIGWLSTAWRGITSTGLITYGEAIARQPYSIFSTTGNTADSIVIPLQNVTYSTPRSIIKFPATAGSVWTNSYKYNVNVNVTITSLALNNVTFTRATTCAETDSVLGWGKMKVKRINGSASGDMNFIAVKRKVTFTDSLMMGAAPAPAALLATFGLTQGLVTNLYTINWYREGEVTPLLTANYANNSYSPALDGSAHLNRLASPTGISEMTLSGEEVSLYPSLLNAGNSITIEAKNAATGKWSYALVNITGQVIAQNTLSANTATKFVVATNASLASGNYYLAISKDGMPVTIKAVTIK